jgi:hypothetical protein
MEYEDFVDREIEKYIDEKRREFELKLDRVRSGYIGWDRKEVEPFLKEHGERATKFIRSSNILSVDGEEGESGEIRIGRVGWRDSWSKMCLPTIVETYLNEGAKCMVLTLKSEIPFAERLLEKYFSTSFPDYTVSLHRVDMCVDVDRAGNCSPKELENYDSDDTEDTYITRGTETTGGSAPTRYFKRTNIYIFEPKEHMLPQTTGD